MSAEYVETKFLQATSLSLPSDQAQQLLGTLRHAGGVPDVNRLFDGVER